MNVTSKNPNKAAIVEAVKRAFPRVTRTTNMTVNAAGVYQCDALEYVKPTDGARKGTFRTIGRVSVAPDGSVAMLLP